MTGRSLPSGLKLGGLGVGSAVQRPAAAPWRAATQKVPHIAVSQDVSTQLPLAEFSLRCIYPEDPLEASVPPSTHDVTCPTCSRPIPPPLLDAAVQTPSRSVASTDAITQLPLTEFLIACVYSRNPLDRQGLPSAHCNAGSASPPQPADTATLCSPRSTSCAGDCHAGTTAPRASPQPPPGLENYAHLRTSHGIPVKAAPVRPRLHTSTSVTPPHPRVSTTQVGTHPDRSSATCKRSASTALAGTHSAIGADPRTGRGPFPKPRALVLPKVKIRASQT